MSFLSAMTLLLFFVSSVRLANVWRADLLMVSGNTKVPQTATNEGVMEILASVVRIAECLRSCRWHDLSSMERDQIRTIGGKKGFLGRRTLITERTSLANLLAGCDTLREDQDVVQ